MTLSFPQLFLAVVFMAARGPSLFTIIAVLGRIGRERYTRVVRVEVLDLREKDFMEVARAMGTSPLRTLLRHLLPRTVCPSRRGHGELVSQLGAEDRPRA